MKVAAKQRKSVEFGRVHGRRDKWAPVYVFGYTRFMMSRIRRRWGYAPVTPASAGARVDVGSLAACRAAIEKQIGPCVRESGIWK